MTEEEHVDYTWYRGKQYKVLSWEEAYTEYDRQKELGEEVNIISRQNGYIVAKAISSEEEFRKGI